MPATWTHPKLGTFKYKLTGWEGKVKARAFDVFTFDNGLGSQRKPNGTYALSFDGDDENDTPSAEAADLALKILAAQEELPAKVVKALWDDFNGRGPDSGMWWHDGLDELVEVMEDADDELKPPKKADDLYRLLWLHTITVRKRVDGYEKPVVELTFNAPFEEEHDVGVLTDGKKVLGTGYATDVTPFESE
jgi:hypothetical protein